VLPAEDGRRTVTLPAVVVEALAEHLRRYTAKSPVGHQQRPGDPEHQSEPPQNERNRAGIVAEGEEREIDMVTRTLSASSV
jgi:hypothetical protein